MKAARSFKACALRLFNHKSQLLGDEAAPHTAVRRRVKLATNAFVSS
ncbi:MAG: hypothetical protein QHJ82_11650 [Verrucomicrobiota bacterium]|nr:hypothetical protein [Verrucomicrobiota bacterium]